MEPDLSTVPELAAVLQELAAREPIFHRPELGHSRVDFENMTTPDFWEIGASGQRYSRQFVIDTLVERHAKPHQDAWETSDFQCRQLASDLYLLTYTLVQDHARVTRRSTIWRRTDAGWKIAYHQGTMVQG